MTIHRNLTAVLALALTTGAAMAQSWPNGSVQLLVPSRPGGGTDIMGRIFADYLQQATGTPVVVVNQPGGGGLVAFEEVRNATPDGQTLLFNHTGMQVMYHTGRYEHPVSAFTTLGIAMTYPPQVFAVAANAPWQTMREFVEDARANPGQRTIGVSLGGTTHFIAGTIMLNEGVDLRLVEAGPEVDKIAGIQGGHIHIGNLGAGTARQFEESGQMRVLCMIDPVPSPDYPDYIPCVDQGVDVSWFAPLVVWGPAGMDPATAQAINTALRGMADDATVQQRLAATDSAYVPRDLAESQALIAREDATIDALARHLGLSAH